MIKKGLTSIIILGILFVGLSRLLGLSDGGVESVASYVAYPFLRLQKMITQPYISWQKRRCITKNLLVELEGLMKERNSLVKELIALKGLQRYQAETQDMRDYLKRYDTSSSVVAPILLKNFSGGDFYLIDAGENFGITKDMIALYNNNLIGKVTEVYPSYSKVSLVTDPHCNVAAYCASNGVKGIHHGLNQGRTTLSYVDHRDEVHKGDLVLSSGEGGLFPRGFALGKIAHADSDGYSRSILIKPLVDLKGIDYCCIVPNTIRASD